MSSSDALRRHALGDLVGVVARGAVHVRLEGAGRNRGIPLAIAHGSEEQMVDLGYLQRLTAPTLWRGQVQLVDGAGHATQWERADAFDRLVDAFASSL
ncbi:pimeloyl-ACP methyl ester carboxylesterase [Bradyrhizobium elkanii]